MSNIWDNGATRGAKGASSPSLAKSLKTFYPKIKAFVCVLD